MAEPRHDEWQPYLDGFPALTRQRRCVRDLQWRTQLPPLVALDVLRARLVSDGGYRDATRSQLVWHFAHAATSDELVIVPASRRADIRVHYMVPHDARAAWALRRWVDLAWQCHHVQPRRVLEEAGR